MLHRRFVFVALLFALFVPNLLAQGNEELAKYIRDNYEKREVMIPMRDGVKLFTSIYTPEKKNQKYPILLNRTPYRVAPYGKDKDGKDQFKGSLARTLFSPARDTFSFTRTFAAAG